MSERAGMAYRKHHVITMRRLNRGLDHVRSELDAHGFWTNQLAEIEVYLTWFGTAYGYQCYGTTGEILIPAVSFSRLQELWPSTRPVPLTDLLRHEYGHAIAYSNRGLLGSRQFRGAFGTYHDDPDRDFYDSQQHVSNYAATNASEDFAEVFMYYLKHSGQLPRRFDTVVIRKKWNFVRRLSSRIRQGKRRWAA